MAEDAAETSDRLLTTIGAGAGVLQLAAFTWVGVLLFDSVPYVVVAGGLTGVGAFLFVPWLLSNAAAHEASSLEPASERRSRSTGPGCSGSAWTWGAS
ncbi:MAG: hypothetical protein ACOCQL_02545 [Halolamina sp.]